MGLKVVSMDVWQSFGTELIGHVDVAYADLVAAFGEPIESDNFKVSGEWILVDDENRVYTIYDWKSTNLYDPHLQSVEEFRSNPNPQRFNIGGIRGVSKPELFKKMLMSEIWERSIFKDRQSGGCETCGEGIDSHTCVHDEYGERYVCRRSDWSTVERVTLVPSDVRRTK